MHQPLAEIRTACHERLEARKRGANGNYCKSCGITVIDFTDKTPEEISQSLRSGQVHCGTFRRESISTGSRTEAMILRLRSGRWRFAAAVLLSLVLLVSCRVRRGKLSAYSQAPAKGHPIENLN